MRLLAVAKERVFETRVGGMEKAQKCVPRSHCLAILYNVYYDSSLSFDEMQDCE